MAAQRHTHKAALRLARACIAQAQAELNRMAGTRKDVVKAWLDRAMRCTADTLPIDMAQLARLAKRYKEQPCALTTPQHGTVSDFLKFCKDNAK